MSSITAQNIKVSYSVARRSGRRGLFNQHQSQVAVLDDISFQLEKGDRVAIIGPNGSGKSTLLKVLGGLIPVQHGSLKIEGDALVLLNRRSGLIADATLKQNAMLKAYSLGLKGQAVIDFVNNSLVISGLSERANDPLKILSTGMSGRFNIAINSQVFKPITILDEWIGTLDVAQVDDDSILARMTHEADILVLASHNETLVRTLCNKALMLNQGKIVYQGSDLDLAFEQLAQLKQPGISASAKNGELVAQSAKQKVHILHMGQTGGYLVKSILKKAESAEYQFVGKHVSTTLTKIPVGESVILFVLDPVERFCRQFNTRQKKGQPFYDGSWSAEEAVAFAQFSSANDLAESLSASDATLRASAFRAMQHIHAMNLSYLDYLGTSDSLSARQRDIVFLGGSSNLVVEVARLLATFGLDASLLAQLEQDSRLEHFTKAMSDHLSELARRNLVDFYRQDIMSYELLMSQYTDADLLEQGA